MALLPSHLVPLSLRNRDLPLIDPIPPLSFLLSPLMAFDLPTPRSLHSSSSRDIALPSYLPVSGQLTSMVRFQSSSKRGKKHARSSSSNVTSVMTNHVWVMPASISVHQKIRKRKPLRRARITSHMLAKVVSRNYWPGANRKS